MLAYINIWLDVIGFIVLFVMFGVVGFLFLVGVFTGRIKERFIQKHWHILDPSVFPDPVEKMFTMPTRIWHWVNLISFAVLITSGFYIRQPFFDGGMDLMKRLHFIFMYVVVIAFISRLAYGFLTADKENWKFTKKDIPVVLQVVLYYLGINSTYDHLKKYHVIQRVTYLSMGLMMIVQAYTGFALMWPRPLLGPISGLFGGIAAAGAWMRFIHAAIMRIYVFLAIAHGYLSTTEDWPWMKYFWFGIYPPPYEHHGEHHGDASHASH